ncbi:MAG: hypothetical protein IH948_05735, partial [Bacteroidetes bacterium]|nr:hypothetical protein [Bacteroidota bacterium]
MTKQVIYHTISILMTILFVFSLAFSYGQYLGHVEAISILRVQQGGTGAGEFSANTLLVSGSSSTTAMQATSSPTVSWLTATDTGATSTFYGGVEITSTGGILVANLSSCDTIDTDSSGVLVCGTDGGGGVTADSLDFSDFKDAMNLDANTTISTGGLTLTLDLDTTGLFEVTGGMNVTGSLDVTGDLQVSGTYFGATFDTATAAALTIAGTNATAVSICNSAACDTITIGTNSDADTITIGEANDDVSITDADWSIASDGTILAAGITGTSL